MADYVGVQDLNHERVTQDNLDDIRQRVGPTVKHAEVEVGATISHWRLTNKHGQPHAFLHDEALTGLVTINHDKGRVGFALGDQPEPGKYAQKAIYLDRGGSFRWDADEEQADLATPS